MNTRKLCLMVVVFLFVAAPVMADMRVNLKYNVSGLYGTTNGGEFLIRVLEDPVGIYAEDGQFTTFCIETNEYVYNNTNYYVTIDSVARRGGSGGPKPDPLSPQSAYLYSSWLDNTISHSDTNANALQRAIWYFEQESGGQNNSLVTQANSAVASGGSWYNKWGADSIGDIRVMNLWTCVNHTGYAQDQLVRVPVPGAILLGLLGLTAAGVKLRKFA